MKEVQQLCSRRLVAEASNHRNGPSVGSLLNLPLGSKVLVFRDGQANRSGKWIGLFKLIGIENETFTVRLPSGPTKVRCIVVKEFTNEDTMSQIINEHIENKNQHILSPHITHQHSQ